MCPRCLLALFLNSVCILLWLIYRKRLPRTSFGSAGFGDPRRESDLLWKRTAPFPRGGVLLGQVGKQGLVVPRSLAVRHGIILGGSGTGKSFSFFLPNARASARRASLVFTDPKSELWRYTSGYHTKAVRYAPGDVDNSACFNFIPLCKDARMAELIARAIVESGNTQRTEQVWLDLETAYLSAVFAHTATLSCPTPETAYHLMTRQSQEELLTQLLASSSTAAVEQAHIIQATSERIRGAVVPVVAARLQFLRDPAIIHFTSRRHLPPQLDRLRYQPTGVYWCLREQDIARLRPLTAAFFTVLFEQLAADSDRTLFGEPVPVTLFLDEFATVIGSLPHFDTTISLARGRQMAIWLGVQSLAQLERYYGPAAARVILTNCTTKITLSGLDYDSAEYISKSLGEKTEVTHSRSWHRRPWGLAPNNVSSGRGEHSRRLLMADEVRRMPEEELLVILGNRRPLRVAKGRYTLTSFPARQRE